MRIFTCATQLEDACILVSFLNQNASVASNKPDTEPMQTLIPADKHVKCKASTFFSLVPLTLKNNNLAFSHIKYTHFFCPIQIDAVNVVNFSVCNSCRKCIDKMYLITLPLWLNLCHWFGWWIFMFALLSRIERMCIGHIKNVPFWFKSKMWNQEHPSQIL